jgi:hypothetical protein
MKQLGDAAVRLAPRAQQLQSRTGDRTGEVQIRALDPVDVVARTQAEPGPGPRALALVAVGGRCGRAQHRTDVALCSAHVGTQGLVILLPHEHEPRRGATGDRTEVGVPLALLGAHCTVGPDVTLDESEVRRPERDVRWDRVERVDQRSALEVTEPRKMLRRHDDRRA